MVGMEIADTWTRLGKIFYRCEWAAGIPLFQRYFDSDTLTPICSMYP
jgi:hypothetical protein